MGVPKPPPGALPVRSSRHPPAKGFHGVPPPSMGFPNGPLWSVAQCDTGPTRRVGPLSLSFGAGIAPPRPMKGATPGRRDTSHLCRTPPTRWGAGGARSSRRVCSHLQATEPPSQAEGMPTAPPEHSDPIPLTEAAELVGRTRRTLERRVAAGDLVSRRVVVDGRPVRCVSRAQQLDLYDTAPTQPG